jgi:hypothetical protein
MSYKMIGCQKRFDVTHCIDCDKSGDPGTCLSFRIDKKRQALMETSNGEVVAF